METKNDGSTQKIVSTQNISCACQIYHASTHVEFINRGPEHLPTKRVIGKTVEQVCRPAWEFYFFGSYIIQGIDHYLPFIMSFGENGQLVKHKPPYSFHLNECSSKCDQVGSLIK